MSEDLQKLVLSALTAVSLAFTTVMLRKQGGMKDAVTADIKQAVTRRKGKREEEDLSQLVMRTAADQSSLNLRLISERMDDMVDVKKRLGIVEGIQITMQQDITKIKEAILPKE